MVAITVALVGIATLTVLNISSDTGNSDVSDSSIEATQTSEGLRTTVLKDNNVEEFVVQGPDNKEVSLDSSTGSVETLGDGAGRYEVIAIKNDGSAQVVTTTEIEENTTAANSRTATFTQSGKVSINPPIEDAIVKSVEDGIVIDTTRTNSNGEYSLGVSKDSNIIVIVNGFDDSQITGTLYASAKENSDNDNSVDFSFNEGSSENVNINGNNLLISYYDDSSVKEIGTSEQLQAIDKVTNGLSSNYELVNDINISESSNINEFNPIGSSSDPFKGTINGRNNTIKDLEISNSSDNTPDNKIGLIRYSDNSNIKNIIFSNPSVTGNNNVGTLIGDSSSDTIEDIKVINGDVNGYRNNGGLIGRSTSNTIIDNVSIRKIYVDNSGYVAGGVIGNNEAIIKESDSSGTIEGTYQVGGLVGYNQGEVENSKSSAEIIGNGDSGGLVGQNPQSDSKIINSYSTGSVTTDTQGYTGGLVGSNYGSVKDSYSTASVKLVDDYGGGLVGYNEGSVNSSYSKSDIVGGRIIGGLIGFNAEVSSDIKNTYYKGKIQGDDSVGGLIGENVNSNISNSYVEAKITSEGEAAGLIHSNKGSSDMYANINDVYYRGNITGKDAVAGLIVSNKGRQDGSAVIKNSYVSGNISSTDEGQVGGLVERNVGASQGNASIYNVSVNANLSSQTDGSTAGEIGGLISNNAAYINGKAIIKNSSVNVNITTNSEAGGVVQYNNGGNVSIFNTEVKSNISTKKGQVGGIVTVLTIPDSDSGGDIINTSYEGNITAGEDSGGIIGYFDMNNDATSNITNTHFNGKIKTNGYGVGGLIGSIQVDTNNNLDIKESHTTGRIENTRNGEGDHTGGLIGITYSYDTINQNKIFINNSYSQADIEGGKNIGGLYGNNPYSTINHSYFAGSIIESSSTNNKGGLIGLNRKTGKIKNSYWYSTSVANAIGKTEDAATTSGEIQKLTESEIKGSSAETNMGAFDFTNKWTTKPSDYPELLD